MITTAIKERPILFSGPMVRAILDGRKTQTRRIIKGNGTWSVDSEDDGKPWPGYGDEFGDWVRAKCPYGQPGDRLWVRETFGYAFDCGHFNHLHQNRQVLYKVGDTCVERWRPSIHMPRWASRINLEITGIRVERLQEISEEDAEAEGSDTCLGEVPLFTYTEAYQVLWESINGEGSWDANPFVWVVEFKRAD